ncbi:MAG: hypothetical protein K0S33_1814 [Bacteroidetes bacterium]|jgi:hypothetical protein|nr:hypothetical protein [Bacteroidota bacterium]
MDFILPVAIIFTLAILYTIYTDRKSIIKRKIRKTEGKNIGEVQEGEVVKIKGSVVFRGKTLIAPLSGRKCAYYHVIITHGQGKNRHEWINEEKAGDVIIQNGKHFAIITTDIVKTYIHPDKSYNSGFLNNATPRLEKYLQKHGEKSEDWLGLNKTLDYKEGILEEGEVIAVVGKAEWVHRKEVRMDLPCERVLLIRRDNEHPVYFSDDVDIVDHA